MGLYTKRDLKSEPDGDLVVENGDLVVASVKESVTQYLVNWTVTTRGGFSMDPQVGWGGEAFIGFQNAPRTHGLMERDLLYSFSLAKDLVPGDLRLKIAPVDQDVAGITLLFDGLIQENDGSTLETDIEIGFSMPFDDGQIQLELTQDE